MWRNFHNSVKLLAMPCRVTQDGCVIVKNSDKMWSTRGGNGKPLQYSCLENLMNSMIISSVLNKGASLVAQTVKNLTVMLENQVRSLGGEDPLEKGMATHSSTPAWRISWTEKLGGGQSTGSQRVQHDWATNIHAHTFIFNPPQWLVSNKFLFLASFSSGPCTFKGHQKMV